MSNENNIANNLIKIESQTPKRSNSLDKQLWSHAWEEAYLSLQTKNNAVNGHENTHAKYQSLDNEKPENMLPNGANDVAKPSFQQPYLEVGDSNSSPIKESIQMINNFTSKNTSVNSSINTYALANSSLNINNVTATAKATPQATQSINLPDSVKTEIANKGFHVYVTENGEIKVWMRNQALTGNAGFELLQKLRHVFCQLGYTLAYFSLNGESMFIRSDGQSSEPHINDESNQSLIDKSY